jgi:hypothetical protein
MAVSAPHDPPIRAGHAAGPWPSDSRATNVLPPCLVHHACAHSRFVPENKATVPDLVTSKLPGFESKDMARRRIEAANRLAEQEQFAKLRLAGEVANEVWSHISESSAAARSAASANN